METVGSKLQVWQGLAKHTSGGLKKADLMKSPRTGEIISKLQYANGLKQAKHLGITPSAGSGIFSSLLDSIGLGLPKRKTKKGKKKASKGTGMKKGMKKGKKKASKGTGMKKGKKTMKRSRKQKGGNDAWDSFKKGFEIPVKIATKVFPFL